MDMKSWIKQGCLELGLEPNRGNLGVVSKFLDAFAEAVQRDLGPKLAEANPWQQAVVDELVVLHLLNDSNAHDPKKAMADVIEWNMKIALDPAVSKEARDLQASGQTILVKFQGRVSGSYEKAHYDIFLNPAKVTYLQGNGYRTLTDVWADGKWFEVSGKADEVAKRLGIVKGE